MLYGGIIFVGEKGLGASSANRLAVLALAAPALAGLWLIFRMEEPAGRRIGLYCGPEGAGKGLCHRWKLDT